MLPIESVVKGLCAKISKQDCILVAPPGAGKSTYLPLQLLCLPALSEQTIIMLQPRQVAARSIARFLSQQLGEKLGHTVGYQVRGDRQLSQHTRLLIMTEGMLTAKLQSDPELTGVALIIFDEFHERSVHSDLALGLSLEVQQGLRDDLRLLVMSATLDVQGIAKLLPDAGLIECEGRAFPVQYYYRPMLVSKINSSAGVNKNSFKYRQGIIAHIVNVIQEALAQHTGNMLVFLAGVSDIVDIQNRLLQLSLDKVVVAPLYGALTSEQQQTAIELPPSGLRKIVLATNIAETSLTIDGVNIVIDTGREKVQRYNLGRGGNSLIEQDIDKASSIQRAGRAGRQQAGYCYRLWDAQKQQHLVENSRAQILQMDVARELLLLLEWGSNFDTLALIDKPSPAQIDAAFKLLDELSFLHAGGTLNKNGKAAAKFNTQPRLAKLLLMATTSHKQHAYLIALVVSILEGKPLHKIAGSIDITAQIRFLKEHKNHPLHQDVKRWSKALKVTSFSIDFAVLPELLMHSHGAFIAKRTANGRYSLANGSGAIFHSRQAELLAEFDWIVCLDLNISSQANAEIRLFVEIAPQAIETHIAAVGEKKHRVFWDKQSQRVACKLVHSLKAITLNEQACEIPNNEKNTKLSQALIIDYIKSAGVATFGEQVGTFVQRINLARQINPALNLPDLKEATFFDDWESWLAPFLNNVRSAKQISGLNWLSILQSRLTWEQQQELEKAFPLYFIAPTGNKHKFQYDAQHGVSLSIRLQELYGLNSHIMLGDSNSVANIPVTLSLLSPAHREIQKTQDLPGFWQGSYAMVKKEMKGRYPKHYWPDNPANAKPTTKTKKNM